MDKSPELELIEASWAMPPSMLAWMRRVDMRLNLAATTPATAQMTVSQEPVNETRWERGTTLDFTVCHRCLHSKHDHTEQGCRWCHFCDAETLTDAPPPCEHEPDPWAIKNRPQMVLCVHCKATMVLRWVPVKGA